MVRAGITDLRWDPVATSTKFCVNAKHIPPNTTHRLSSSVLVGTKRNSPGQLGLATMIFHLMLRPNQEPSVPEIYTKVFNVWLTLLSFSMRKVRLFT